MNKYNGTEDSQIFLVDEIDCRVYTKTTFLNVEGKTKAIMRGKGKISLEADKKIKAIITDI